jgi:hypothetical protein
MNYLIVVILTLIAGVVGGLIASLPRLRPERWQMKRELYSRLLEKLGEVVYVLDELLVLARYVEEIGEGPLRAEDEERERRLRDRGHDAYEDISRVSRIAAIVLPPDVLTVLGKMDVQLAKAERETPRGREVLGSQRKIARTAYDLVLIAAKKDLGMQRFQNWMRPRRRPSTGGLAHTPHRPEEQDMSTQSLPQDLSPSQESNSAADTPVQHT